MRGEELGRSGNFAGAGFLVLLEPRKDFVFPLGDVELVEPADDLDVLADVLSQHLDRAVEDGIVGEQVGRDEEFGVVAFALEHERHGFVPVAAVVGEEQSVRLALGVAAGARPVEQPCDRRTGCLADDLRVDDSSLGVGEDLWLADLDSRLRGDDADAGVAVGVHEPQCDDPVEPGVGDFVGHSSAALVAAPGGVHCLLQCGDGLGLFDPFR